MDVLKKENICAKATTQSRENAQRTVNGRFYWVPRIGIMYIFPFIHYYKNIYPQAWRPSSHVREHKSK